MADTFVKIGLIIGLVVRKVLRKLLHEFELDKTVERLGKDYSLEKRLSNLAAYVVYFISGFFESAGNYFHSFVYYNRSDFIIDRSNFSIRNKRFYS